MWGKLLLISLVVTGIVCDANTSDFSHENLKKVAIIGSGAGGSSCAYFLRKLGGEEIDIEIFEREQDIGGRVKSVEFANEIFEAGGGVYHDSNLIFSNLMKEANLKPLYSPPIERQLGIWNGNEFTFLLPQNSLLQKIAGLYRYSLAPLWVSQEGQRILNNFLNIYKLLEEGPFESVEELVKAIKLKELTELSLRDYLFANNFCNYDSFLEKGRYCDEIVTGFTRVNYGQSMDLNALVGMIAYVGSDSEHVFAVEGGNSQVLRFALSKSNSKLNLNAQVTKIVKEENNKFTIHFTNGQTLDTRSGFDQVVIAAPLEFANITFENLQLPSFSFSSFILLHY